MVVADGGNLSKYNCKSRLTLLDLPIGGHMSLMLTYAEWYDHPPKFDIRIWKTDTNTGVKDIPYCSTGVTLDDDEAITFCTLISMYLKGNSQLEGRYLIISSQGGTGKALKITRNPDGTGDNFLLTVVKFVNYNSYDVLGEEDRQVSMNKYAVRAISEAIYKYLTAKKGRKKRC